VSPIHGYGETQPQLGEDAWVAPDARVVGAVELGAAASVWYGCVLRGDVMPIRIGARTNIQDLSLAHGTTDRYGVDIGAEVTVGHRVILHGCTVADRALIGMGAVLLDGCVIESGAFVAAGAVVPPGMRVPAGMLAAGVPAKVRREVDAAQQQQIADSAAHYMHLARRHREELG